MDFEGCRLLFGVSGCLKTLAEGLSKRLQPTDIHGFSVIASPSVPFRQQAVDLFGQHVHSVFQFGDALAVAWGGIGGRLHQKQDCCFRYRVGPYDLS